MQPDQSQGSDPDAWTTEHSAAAVGHWGPVKSVLYPFYKEELEQSTVGTLGPGPGLWLHRDYSDSEDTV